MNKELKQIKECLNAANQEAESYMRRMKELEEEVAALRSDKVMLMWQMDIIRATVSRVVQ
jgi:predicted  nucleic acid-binding Zn-ribbon protein